MRRLSSKPSKARKRYYNTPLHRRWKDLSAPLAENLVREYGVKRLPVRSGDTVLIVRGEYSGHEGKVVKVDLKERRIHVEGVTKTKADGTSVFYPLHPSKVIITRLDLSDSWRKKILERRKR